MLLVIYFSIGFGVTSSVGKSDESTLAVPPHCYKRISGGERLIGYDITRIIERSTVKECEEECDIYKCTHFSFGNVTGGIGTCELTTDREISRTQDPNFDLYQRTDECAEGKPTGYEKACYRRIITGKRLHERFIRHSLPCNSLQACQHQCSIEKHFTCQGFNIRLDPAKVGRGICELSSILTKSLDLSRDFVFDPEFAYYERNHDNDLPNCGHYIAGPNTVFSNNPVESMASYQPSIKGGPYYGGDSYGPWSTGHGTVDHGPWGSHGYGSGFYESNNPSRGPAPSFHPDASQGGPYSYGYGHRDGSQETIGPPGKPRAPFLPDTLSHSGFHGFKDGRQNNGFIWGDGLEPFPRPSIIEGQDSHSGYGYGYAYSGGFQSYEFTGGSYSPRTQRPSLKQNPQSQQGSSPVYGYGYGYGTTPNIIGFPKAPEPYGYGLAGGGKPHLEYPKIPDYQGKKSVFAQNLPAKHPIWNRRHDRTNRIPFYIIIDADARRGYGGVQTNYPPNRPNVDYLPARPQSLPPPPQSLSPTKPRLLPQPSQRPPLLPLQPQWQPPPSHLIATGNSDKFEISSNFVGREVCFRREHSGFKLNPNTIRAMYETAKILDCENMCTNSPFKCTGYSFRYSSSDSGPNCLLTDYTSLNPETHLLPDRSCDVYLKMSTCMEFNRGADTECFLRVATNRKLDSSKLIKAVTVRGISDCELACLNSAFFTCRSFSFRHGSPIIGEPVENCFLSDWPISALTHMDFVPLNNHEVYERGSFGHGCELDAGQPHIGPRPPFSPYLNVPQVPQTKEPWDLKETWRHFTVNGWPCRAGTECELNAEAGFWACEVEGGDRAQWDYCCMPKHSCGFSRGYNYPWCYVGEARPNQWRPCSEFYYPEFGNRYPYKPVQSHNTHFDHYYGPTRNTRPWTFGSEELGPPSYWPISYLYAEPPPNETYVWDQEEQRFYHHRNEDYKPYLSEPPENGPKIRFKSCSNRHPYPRAVIQKLDLKNVPKAGNPEEQSKKTEGSRISKAEEESSLGFSPENRDRKTSQDFFASAAPASGNLTRRETNGTNSPLNKTKEVIKEVEKIIMESTGVAEPEKNESLKKVETKHSGFFSVNLLQTPDFWN